MARHLMYRTLTVLNGQTVGVLEDHAAAQMFAQAIGVTIFTPDTLPEATPTISVAHKESPVAGDYARLQTQAGTDFPVLVADRATPLPFAPFAALKITLGGAAGADRAFQVLCQIDSSFGGVIP